MAMDLPQVTAPFANYVPCLIVDKWAFVSGQFPVENGAVTYIGKLGDNISVEQGQKAAELCAKLILAHLKAAIQDLSKVKQCLKLSGFVNATPDFSEHPKVINGASDFMVNFLGERGKHAREAVGVYSLPFGASVEVSAIFLLE